MGERMQKEQQELDAMRMQYMAQEHGRNLHADRKELDGIKRELSQLAFSTATPTASGNGLLHHLDSQPRNASNGLWGNVQNASDSAWPSGPAAVDQSSWKSMQNQQPSVTSLPTSQYGTE